MKSSFLFVVACTAAVSVAAAQDTMVAVRDAQSGQLRAATAAELRALGAPSLALHAPAGQVITRSDGRRQLHLGEAALVHVVLRRDADGRASMACIEGAGAGHGNTGQAGAAASATEAHHADR